MARDIPKEFLGLFGTSVILWFLNPAFAELFRSGLSDPTFAASPIGLLWGVVAGFFDFQLDILIAWISWLLSLFRGSSGGGGWL